MAEAARNHESNEDEHPGENQPALTFEVMQRLSIRAGEVWLYYLGMGGGLDEWEVTAYLHGVLDAPTLDRDLISQAVNELYDDVRRTPRAPYSWQCPADGPAAGPGPAVGNHPRDGNG